MGEVHIKIKHDTDTNLTQVLTVHTTVVIAITLPSAKRILKSHVMKKQSDVQLSFPCYVSCVENFLVTEVT